MPRTPALAFVLTALLATGAQAQGLSPTAQRIAAEVTPRSPDLRIKRSTVQWATSVPSRRN